MGTRLTVKVEVDLRYGSVARGDERLEELS